MNDEASLDKRRTRLRAMRECYEQQPVDLARTMPVVSDPVTDSRPRRAGDHRDRPGRMGGREQPERPGGGLLQRLVQFLTEPNPGDSLIPGTGVGEQRLRQAVRLLEQRSKTALGGAGERIQRLLRFLTQDIPGEPMVAGVNLKRLRQLLERAGVSPALAASAAAGEIPEAGTTMPRTARSPSTTMEPAVTPDPTPAPAPAATVTNSVSEIAVIEETLRELRDMTRDLQLRLDEARRQVETLPGRVAGQQRSSQVVQATPMASKGIQPSGNRQPQAESVPATQPRPEGDDWFAEFLE